MKHEWRRTHGGDTDTFAHDVETETQGHNGPRCTVCGFFFCEHCHPAGWDGSCPGPAPRGTRWNWIGDGTGEPQAVPSLWRVQ